MKASDEGRARELIGGAQPEIAEPARLHPWIVALAIGILVLLLALLLAGELQWF